jgi:DNA-directed RNA polymerase subunit beta
MKLHHLVDTDKMHARSTGPYTLVTQQPWVEKAQLRRSSVWGEMEVWALEAYGAANTPAGASHDKVGRYDRRAKVYEAIVKGVPHAARRATPRPFNVMVQEPVGWQLDITVYDAKGKR